MIANLGSEFVASIDQAFESLVQEFDDIEIAWKKLQVVAVKEIEAILRKRVSNAKITIPTAKSVYPDIKIENIDGIFAIDIKSNELQKDPWFDMGRLDTLEEERMDKFTEEWEIVIQYDSETKKYMKSYFNLFREVVGRRDEINGIKYRPYDGKVRPKSWAAFEQNVIYWTSKEEFKDALDRSLKHRWKENIRQHLVSKLTAEEIEEFKKLFDQ